jgi:hypothetical protein
MLIQPGNVFLTDSASFQTRIGKYKHPIEVIMLNSDPSSIFNWFIIESFALLEVGPSSRATLLVDEEKGLKEKNK